VLWSVYVVERREGAWKITIRLEHREAERLRSLLQPCSPQTKRVRDDRHGQLKFIAALAIMGLKNRTEAE